LFPAHDAGSIGHIPDFVTDAMLYRLARARVATNHCVSLVR
jgi:hypothetical protein